MPVTRLSLSELMQLSRSLAASPALWHPHVRFDAGRRHWARLPGPADVDVWLLTWLPEQGTDLHDQGDSAAAFTVLTGELDEVRASPSGGRGRQCLRVGDTHGVAPGVVHDVVNGSAAPAVSLHAYFPRLTSMTFWRSSPVGLRPVRTVTTDEPELAAR